ncbi:MAG: chemotaxis protein CheA [Gammaproteobacteria bacterium]|nr:chemotaxis protein CheA [Gammaproteobacteria bacterium]
MELDDEILQDFLLEAGEILEQLDSQLVDLESDPESRELLNAVFRGFHTIKGGAGFLGVDNLVAVSHKSEDIFDLLRNGKLSIDAQLMDVFLQVLDVLRRMFDELANGQLPEPAPAELLARLIAHAEGTAAPPSPAAPADVPATDAGLEVGDLLDVTDSGSPAGDAGGDALMAQIVDELTAGEGEIPAVTATPDNSDLITEDEFEALLDKRAAAHAGDEPAAAPAATADLITEDEFEALLDRREAARAVADERAAAPAAGADLITDEEFEAVLDNLHGAGKFTAAAAAEVPAAESPEAETPRSEAPKAEAPKAEAPKAEAPKPADVGKGGGAKQDTTVRVETETLDRIMNMVGELVLIRNRLSNLQSALGDEEVTQTVANLDVVTSDLQMAAMKTRMQPIKKVFGRFPRVVRDLARNLNKQIELKMSGEDTDLDKNLVEALADPLVHLVRNSIDHGIELPADRVAAGKPPVGTLALSAEQAGDQIQLVIRDDGKGIDAEALRNKAIGSGLLDEDAARRLNTRECFELIFLPGFSTKQEISDISGRGVGMDVVKTRITQLNGTIAIESELGVGTTIRISVPLTLAIMPTLMVVLGRQVFALPLVNVQEIISFEAHQAREVDGRKTIIVRGRAIPLFYLSRWLVSGSGEFTSGSGHVVVTRIGNQSVGLLVDELIGQEEVVIKPLGALLHGTKGLAGATITGNGKIALIIDLPGLLEAYARR